MERLLATWIEPLSLERSDGSTLRDTARLLDALSELCPFVEVVRLGLFVLPLRGPSRFFGGDDAVVRIVRHSVLDTVGAVAKIGVAEGLFCAELAAHAEVVVAPGATDVFRRAQPLDVLNHRELAATCRRLGLFTVGSFADLEPARVAERFSGRARTLHRVARGELFELEGQRDPTLGRRLSRLRGVDDLFEEPRSFFGQRGAGDDRADAAARRVRRRLGADGVVVARLCGGRGPEDRATHVPWGSPSGGAPGGAPWPGQLGAPSPMITLAHPVPLVLRDGENRPVVVGSRGSLSGAPATVIFSAPLRREVLWYAGPWPLVERWWSRHRRRAHVQLVLVDGEALLVVAEAERWWLAGIYD